MKLNQQGISQLVIVVVILLGLLATIYLVKQRQVAPKAASSTFNHAQETLLAKAQPPLDEFGNRIVLKSEQAGLANNPLYVVEYQPPFNQYILVIYGTPIEEVRQQAEEALLEQADRGLTGLCALNFKVVAPGFVMGGEAGEDSQLGICKPD